MKNVKDRQEKQKVCTTVNLAKFIASKH